MAVNSEQLKQCAQIAIQGNKHALTGDYLKAVQCYSEAIQTYSIDFGLFLNRALCYIKMDFIYLALLDINQAVRLSEQNAKCYYIRSHVLKKLNECDLAKSDLEVALELEPSCEDISDELIKIKNQNDKEISLFKEKLNLYDLNDKTYYKIKTNFHLVQASDLPTNIWNYQGVRVENVRSDISIRVIQEYFSLFGNIKDVKKIYLRTACDNNANIMVHYFNPVTPMFTIAYFQNKIFKDLSLIRRNTIHGQSYQPLHLYFAPTDSQIDLKFSRPKHPMINSQECYYWRTTSCHLKERCPKFHIAANKNIDAQIWMKIE